MKDERLIYANIVINIYIIIILVLFPAGAESVYIKNYLADSVCFGIILLLYMRYVCVNRMDLFDPLGLITVIYACLYFITPIYDIVTGNVTWFGYHLFPYGVKACMIALAGYIAFYLCYVCDFQRYYKLAESAGKEFYKKGKTDKIGFGYRLEKEQIVNSEDLKKQMVLIILILYVISFAANVYYLIHSGYSNLLYILTLGILGGNGQKAENVDSIGFVAMFSYSLPTIVMLYWEYAKNIWITVLLFIPMLMMQVARGFRFFVVQIAISFVAYYYIRNHKKPKLNQLLLVFLALMVPVLLMTMFRNDIRGGKGIAFSEINLKSIQKAVEEAVLDNFRIYNNFYGMVHMIPSRYGYVYLRQILIGTVVMAIPRKIWPGKVSTQAGVDLSYIIGSQLARTGQAYPGLGEYYYAFGLAGVVFFMAVYGIWMKHIKNRFKDNGSSGCDLIIFATLLGANLQLLIRGYTPSNVWYIIFSLLPVYIVEFVEKYAVIKEGSAE